MQLFGEPDYLWLFLLGLLMAALYLFRRKAKQVEVSTMPFFKALALEHLESAWLRRLKKWISFLLSIAILSSAILALARLVSNPSGEANYRTCVVLLDRSASMSLLDQEGVSRIAEAGKRIKEKLLSLPEDAGVALVVYDNRPEIVQPRTLIRREFLSRLDETRVRPIAGTIANAIESAAILASLETPALILHASDFGDAAAVQGIPLPTGVTLERLNVALDAPSNVGITSFQVRKAPLEQDSYDVFAQIALNHSAPFSREVELELLVGGVPSQVRNIDLGPGESQTLEFRMRGAGGQILRMQVTSPDDAFPLDNEVAVSLPVARPLVAVWIRRNSPDTPQDAYTHLALSAIQESGTLELLAGTPEQWPLKESVDAVIFDGWLPESWPPDIPAVVINPPGSSGPILARPLAQPIPYDQVREGNEGHPVLFRVATGRIAVTQTVLFQPSGSFEPLWLAGKEPVLAAGEVEGQRIVVMAFSPQMSERLPLTASFPLLLGNAILWVTENSRDAGSQTRDHRTGDFVAVEGKILTWTDWKNGTPRSQQVPLNHSMMELDRIGLWQTDAGFQGSAHLLSRAESNLPGWQKTTNGESAPAATVVTSRWYGVGWMKFFLILILIVLLVESWLFHRHAVY